jgi:secreted trypsin-like serine protease
MRKRFFTVIVPILLALLFVLPLHSASSPGQMVRGEAAAWSKLVSGSASEGTPLLAQPQQAAVPEVFGGREAQPGAWPWQVALVFAREPDASVGQYCGGTLIAPEWVLTAAHCVLRFEPQEVDVILGRHRLSSDEGERIPAAQFIGHPNFNYNPFSLTFDLDSDLALIRLTIPSTQQPVALFSGTAGEEEKQYTGGTVTGWGLTEQFNFSDALREVVVPFVSSDFCIQVYGSLVTKNMICAGYPKGNKDACYGDSGGQLVVHSQEENGWRQIGIVSWGSGCGYPNSPAVYTRISGFTGWIDACLTDDTSQICTGRDMYESDDQPQQATLIQTDSISQTHNFHDRTDRDWVKFEAKASSSYRIEVQPLGVESDPLLWLYDSDGITSLAYDDDSGEGGAAQLVWHAAHDAILFVEIQDAANAKGDGTVYSLTIRQLTIVRLPIVAN